MTERRGDGASTPRRRWTGLWVAAFVLVLLVVRVNLDAALEEVVDRWKGWIIVAAVVAVCAWYGIAKWRRPDRNPLNGATSRRVLGEPYQVALSGDVGYGATWSMRCTNDEVQLGAESVRLADVRAVRVRPAAIHLDVLRDGRPADIAVRPCAYADRQRMLWELAVRVPEAVERGMEADARESTAPAADASTAMSGLDVRMHGIASALVVPEKRSPAPPKSGLGCGLFVAAPRDDGGDDRSVSS